MIVAILTPCRKCAIGLHEFKDLNRNFPGTMLFCYYEKYRPNHDSVFFPLMSRIPGMTFTVLTEPFADYPRLQERVVSVLQALPEEVQRDFLEDPRFGTAIDNYEPAKGWTLFMPTPGPPGQGTRCVVLRPKLETASESFTKYIIAHEFAHAFLHNGGWGEITDVEEAADALAASWGFYKPSTFH